MKKKDIVHHFILEGIPKATIYRIIARSEDGRSMMQGKGQGRPAKIMTKENLKKLKIMFDGTDRQSQRKAASKFGCTQPYISKTLKEKTKIKCYKKQKAPCYSEVQQKIVKTQCRFLNRKSLGKDFVMDDEHFLKLSKSNMPGNDRFYSSNKGNVPNNVKYYGKKKYENMLMLWIAISPKGISQPYFIPFRTAMTQHVYKNRCLKKILVPFLRQHYPEGDYLFWPDKASSHYANSVKQYLLYENVNFVERHRNPTNLPQARPIEDFFGYLDSLVYAKRWSAKNLEQLKNRVKYCLKKVDPDIVRREMEGVRAKLRLCAENGPHFICH